MPESNERPPTNLLDQNKSKPDNQNPLSELYNDPNRQTTRPNILASTIGKIALAGAAIAAVGGGARARQADNPAQPIEDAVNISSVIKNAVTPDQKHNLTPQNSSDPAGEIGSAISAEKTDLTQLNLAYDKFTSDLAKMPAAIMMGMGENLEGFKVAVGENTYKFVRAKNQNDEKILIVENDHQITTITIKDGQITKDVLQKDPSTEQTDTTGNISADTARELNQAYSAWLVQRGKSGENITSSTQAIPSGQTPTVEPPPTSTPEPTNTPTSTPQPAQIDPFDRGTHKAIDNSQPNNSDTA